MTLDVENFILIISIFSFLYLFGIYNSIQDEKEYALLLALVFVETGATPLFTDPENNSNEKGIRQKSWMGSAAK